MKRLATTLAALLLLAATARAQSAVDVTSLGVRQGPEFATANRKLLYNAFAAGYQIFRFPPGTYDVDKPLRPPPGVEFQGYSDRQTTLRSQFGSWTLLCGMGLNPVSGRTGKKTPLTPDHFVDLNPYLDSTAQGRRGFRTRSNAFLAMVGDAFSHPEGGWESVRCLTIETVLSFHDQPGYHTVNLIGLRDLNDVSPIAIAIDGPNIWSAIRTDDGLTPAVSIPCPAWPCTVTLTEQIDLDSGKWLIGLNGIQQKVPTSGLGPNFAKGGLKLRKNELAEMTVGIHDMSSAETFEEPTRNIDFTLAMLRLGRQRVYDDAGIGNALKRLDGRPYTHSIGFTEGPDLISLLGNYDSFEDLNQTATISTRPYNGVAVALQPSNAAVAATARDHRIGGMTIIGGYNFKLADGTPWGYGGAVGLGPVLDFRAYASSFNGACYGLKSWFPTASYKTVLGDCSFSSNRYPLMLWQHMVSVRDFRVPNPGRIPLRFRWCGQVDLDQGFVAGFGPIESVVEFLGGGGDSGWWTVRGVAEDAEGGAYPSRAFVHATGNTTQTGCELLMESCFGGTMGPNAVMLDLDHDAANFKSPASNFAIRHSRLQAGRPCFVRSSSKGWWGTVSLSPDDPTKDKDVVVGDGAGQVKVERGTAPNAIQQAPAPVPQPAPEPPAQGRKARFELLRRAAQ